MLRSEPLLLCTVKHHKHSAPRLHHRQQYVSGGWESFRRRMENQYHLKNDAMEPANDLICNAAACRYKRCVCGAGAQTSQHFVRRQPSSAACQSV